ncbi:MAG: energy transducer TonB [Terriglobia bacterium]
MAASDFDSIPLQSSWRDYRQHPASWVNSLLVHVAILAAIALPYAFGTRTSRVRASDPIIHIYYPAPYHLQVETRGGGGGGQREPLPASRGIIPPFSQMPLAPPSAHPIVNLQLPVQASILGPPDLKLPEMSGADSWGDPNGVLGTRSNGPGCCDGIGTGNGPGVGPDRGPGYGPGPGGPGVYSVGGDVTAPVPVYRPEPPYTEEARKAKLSGVVTLAIVVDAQGNPRDIHIMRSLGMGLDEKAVETVSTWKFKPATRKDVPVAVRMIVEITFRLF